MSGIEVRRRAPRVHPGWRAGQTYHPFPAMGVNSGSALTQDRITLIPFILPAPFHLAGINLRVTTLHASNNLQAAIYRSDANLKVTGSPLVASGNIATDAAAQVAADVTDTWLPAGELLRQAVNSSGGTAAGEVFANTANWLGWIFGGTPAQINTGASNANAYLHTSHTFGTWPDLTAVTPSVQAGLNNFAVFRLTHA